MSKEEEIANVATTQLDNNLAKAKPVKMGWSSKQVTEITKCLNALLANYSVHYQKLRSFHWNVKGSDFFDLHEKFELQYTEALMHIDAIAERIRIFGEAPLSSLKQYLHASEIKETSTELNSDLMVREMLSDYTILIKYMEEVVSICSHHTDSGTESMVKGYINKIEKHHWMFSAFLAR
ncbi:MAG: DNA starvation/stationary phase protection protein [Cyclobacteriaceae bacterium]|nr:DNA starvation/stationary phase protection protein [Cyclobacteriaceae bacterium]